MDLWPGRAFDTDPTAAALLRDAVRKSRLVRVVEIGGADEHSGLTLQLLTLEIRVSGAVLHWKAQPVTDKVQGGPDFIIGDDLGSIYSVFVGTWTAIDGVLQGTTIFVPPPPGPARAMRIDVGRIGGLGITFPPGLVLDEPVLGTWKFTISLE
jgi:hypothetical protein